MSHIFLSHSSANNAEAKALEQWLASKGWTELFLDFDPRRGIAAGERWERALNEAARRCEAVVFIISKAWLSSRWCMNELTLARRLNKKLFGVLVEENLAIADLPRDVTSTWQLVNLAAGRDHEQFVVNLPITGDEAHVTFSREGLTRLEIGLQRAGLDAGYFDWPPAGDPNRPPYRGLKPLEADDAGIFFGREGPLIEAIDRLRGIADMAPPRIMVILGASGAGKSSFLRAGLLPRLARDQQAFLPLPVVRPEHAVLSGETGLVSALSRAFDEARAKKARADVRAAVYSGAAHVKSLLSELQQANMPPALGDEPHRRLPTVVLPIDQAEELFLTESRQESEPFLSLLHDLTQRDGPPLIVIFTIRSDNYERIQQAGELADLVKIPFDLGPMPKGSYAEVVRGPVDRLEDSTREIKLDEKLVEALLADVDAGGAKDALPLLAFTLERLYSEYSGTGELTLGHYVSLGRIKGSIEAAVERVLRAADGMPGIPRNKDARLKLLRRALIPWLASIDPETRAPRRRVARYSELPSEARPLIDLLIEQRLLSKDVAKDTGETIVEPTHEALLRQWSLLQGWLAEDTGLLIVLDGVKSAARDWSMNDRASSWLSHSGDRLRAAKHLENRLDLAQNLSAQDRDYLDACRREERAQSWRGWRNAAAVALVVAASAGGLWLNQSYFREQYHWRWQMAPEARPLADEIALSSSVGKPFSDCRNGCPQMVVLPSGKFQMGSVGGPDGDPDSAPDETPQKEVEIRYPFAIGKYEVTVSEWDHCVDAGACPQISADVTKSEPNWPIGHVSWLDAKLYVAWLSRITGKNYRLLSEAEWEYAARAKSPTRFSFGDDPTELKRYGWTSDNAKYRNPVGQLDPNNFGLYDMHGNVTEWVEDDYHETYEGHPGNDSAWIGDGRKGIKVSRGGYYASDYIASRSTNRGQSELHTKAGSFGFRVARTLKQLNSE